MVGFEYNYLSSFEIIEKSEKFFDFSIFDLWILFGIFIAIILSIHTVLPYINLYIFYKRKENDKMKRKFMIKQIAMQKDINDEIEKEIGI